MAVAVCPFPGPIVALLLREAALAAARGCPGAELADLEQEAALTVLLEQPLYDPARHGPSLLAYLTMCVRSHLGHLGLAGARRQAHERPGRGPLAAEPAEPVDPAAGPAAAAIAAEERAALLPHAREVLPPRQAAVVAGTLAGDGDALMAEALGITAAQVRRDRHLATCRLRSDFE